MTTNEKRLGTLFALGSVYITRRAKEELSQEDIRRMLERHAKGDWGSVGPEDWVANEQALVHEMRLLSAYVSEAGKRVWVITESDRSATTILFPDEY